MRKVRIVLSSPSDLTEERNLIEKEVKKIHEIKKNKITIELVRWEKDVLPLINLTGPQEIIDDTLRIEEADMLICVFYLRFGTQIKNSSLTGTEHEIRQALEAYKKHGKPLIKLYFKRAFNVNIDEWKSKDWSQFKKVLAFRKEMQPEGVIGFFTNEEELRDTIQRDVHMFLDSESFTGDKISIQFSNQTPPPGHPDRNDFVYGKRFTFKNREFKIKVNPGDTDFWRFGLRFSTYENQPSVTGVRNEFEVVKDIHINVGDLHEGQWINSERLSLTDYVSNRFTTIQNDYNGEPVWLHVKSNNDGSKVSFSISEKGIELGGIMCDLRRFNYFWLAAWCDYRPFKLTADFSFRDTSD